MKNPSKKTASFPVAKKNTICLGGETRMKQKNDKILPSLNQAKCTCIQQGGVSYHLEFLL